MKKLFFTLVLLGLLCAAPAAADDYGGGYFHLSGSSEDPTITHELDMSDSSWAFDAPEGYAIAGVELWMLPGEAANWTLYSDEYAISGWYQYDLSGPLNATGSIFSAAVGSQTVTRSSLAPGFHYPEIFGVCPGMKYSGGAMDYEIISQGVFSYTPLYIFSSVHRDPERTVYQELSPLQVIRSVQITNYETPGSLYPAKIYLVTEDRALAIMEAFTPGDAWSYDEEYGGSTDDLLSYIWGMFGLLGSVFALLDILKYIFVDHFFEVLILYEIILLSYSAAKSRDFISFTKKFIKANKALFEFLILITEKIITAVTSIIQALKPI